jgi:hypothetical protein
VIVTDDAVRARLRRRGFVLEYVTLGWNAAGIVVLAVAAVAARLVALAGFGLDPLIEIGASAIVIWELSGTGEDRQWQGLRLIGYAFAAVALYLLAQPTVVLAIGFRPDHSRAGIAWAAVTAAMMFALAAGKARTRDVNMTPDVAGVRQNLKLIVDHGKVAPGINQNAEANFGAALGGAYSVWRSGLGITTDGQVIYAYGPALTAQSLADLLAAGRPGPGDGTGHQPVLAHLRVLSAARPPPPGRHSGPPAAASGQATRFAYLSSRSR